MADNAVRTAARVSAARPTYLGIMDSLVDRGTDPRPRIVPHRRVNRVRWGCYEQRTHAGGASALPIVVATVVLGGLETARELDGRSDLFARPAAACPSPRRSTAEICCRRTPSSAGSPAHSCGRAIRSDWRHNNPGVSLLWPATGTKTPHGCFWGWNSAPHAGSTGHAVCLAGAPGRTRIVELLEAFGRQSTEPCLALMGAGRHCWSW